MLHLLLLPLIFYQVICYASRRTKVNIELVITTDILSPIEGGVAWQQRKGVATALPSICILAAIYSDYQRKVSIAYLDCSSKDFNETVVELRIIQECKSQFSTNNQQWFF